MSIEEIPSDELVVMSDFMHRAFSANGCLPCCHCCGEWIKVDSLFQLLTVKTRGRTWPPGTKYRAENMRDHVTSMEIMICSTCDPVEFEKREYKAAELFKKRKEASRGGCFRINGEIVH